MGVWGCWMGVWGWGWRSEMWGWGIGFGLIFYFYFGGEVVVVKGAEESGGVGHWGIWGISTLKIS